MQFTLTDEQQQLRNAATRFVRDRYTFSAWRRCARQLNGFDAETWRQMASMGWTAVAVPEAYGGLGLGPDAQAIIMESFGEGLVLEPYWSSAVVCAQTLSLAGTPTQKSLWLPRIADGSVRGAFALLEQGTRYDWSALACEARKKDEAWVLNGQKLAVLDAPHADHLVVVARTGGKPGDAAGLSLFWVHSDAPGLKRRDFRTVDERRASDMVLDGVKAELIGIEGAAAGVVEQTIDHGIAALCAEAVGVMSSAVEATVQYLKTRQQFGRPLAQFQVLRHRVADMVMALEQSRSLAMLCAFSLNDSPARRMRVAAAAKAQIGSAGRFIGESAVQLHGGIGVTDELQIGHFMKRLLAIDILLGDTRHHLSRMAQREAMA
ncbi:acyl-CoA dehydrogenase family protein [Ottowia thiooxydans]|uniref:acyl-CoA dehydrogenase family protein n=1 Tax=Ottowia thiooxydans TaxID=219182 RepID=UPI00040AAD09|nr:acyl-CoA dehydrogenase [Ottowia thiooxydans]